MRRSLALRRLSPLAGSALAHAFGVLWVLRLAQPGRAAERYEPPAPFEVDLLAGREERPLLPAAHVSPRGDSVGAGRVAPRRGAPSPEPARAPPSDAPGAPREQETPYSVSPFAAAPLPAGPTPVAPPPSRDDPPSEAGAERLPGPRVDEPDVTGLRRSLARERSDHDRDLGLGPGSAVADVALAAVRGAQPPDGWAVVDVTLDASGRATAVKLSESSVAGFAASVDALRGALGARRVPLPANHHGARVRLKITAKFALPNGQKHLVELAKPFASAGEPGKRDSGPALPKHATWWQGLAPKSDPRVLREGPPTVAGLPVDEGLKIPLLVFDPANIGAKRSLQVGVAVMDVIPL